MLRNGTNVPRQIWAPGLGTSLSCITDRYLVILFLFLFASSSRLCRSYIVTPLPFAAVTKTTTIVRGEQKKGSRLRKRWIPLKSPTKYFKTSDMIYRGRKLQLAGVIRWGWKRCCLSKGSFLRGIGSNCHLFRCGHATLWEASSVRRSVGPSVRRSVTLELSTYHARVENAKNVYLGCCSWYCVWVCGWGEAGGWMLLASRP